MAMTHYQLAVRKGKNAVYNVRKVPLTAWERYILVVEDYAPVRDLYRSALRAAGYTVIGAEDGLDALRLVENQIPQAIVLDLTLPRLGGREVLKELKARPDTQGIPIVLVTGGDASDLNPDNIACVLRKPINVKTLVAAVDDCLRPPPARTRRFLLREFP
jgi:CheY-like chemotaxis protein